MRNSAARETEAWEFTRRQLAGLRALHRSLQLPGDYYKAHNDVELRLSDRARAKILARLVDLGVIRAPLSWDDAIEQCLRRIHRRMLGDLRAMICKEEAFVRRRLMYGQAERFVAYMLKRRKAQRERNRRQRQRNEISREAGGQS
jgi:hypothetical protein